MLDARSVLGSLLEGQSGGLSSRRIEHAVGEGGLGGGLGQILGQLGGRGGGLGQILSQLGAAGSAGGGLGGLGGMLGEARRGNPMAAGGIGALAGAVLGGGKGNILKGAVGGGALAVLGALALDALNRATGSAPGSAAAAADPASPKLRPELSAAVPDDEAGQERHALILLRSMLSAAKADGQIDGNEMQRILGKLDEDGADAETKDFVLLEMRKPVDVEALAAQAGRPELAAQVYAAALLAIEVDTDAERDYLRRLAVALRLDQATIKRLHDTLGAPAVH